MFTSAIFLAYAFGLPEVLRQKTEKAKNFLHEKADVNLG